MLLTCLKSYDKSQFIKDVTAGIIVAIIALPLSIALALASGVGPEAGIFTAIVAGFVISALGGSCVQIAGPTAAFATIVAGIVARDGMDGLIIATIMAGIFLILMGLFHFGSLIKFIPYTITTGFTSGIAVTIVIGQLKDFFGVTYPDGVKPIETTEKMKAFVQNISSVNTDALIVGIVSLAILILANVFESHIYAISSLFIGFIIFAIPIVVREELDTLKGKYAYCPFVLVGAAIVCAITYFNPVGGGNSVNLEHLTVTTGIYVFIAGAVAICAMVLPGISGSTLLLIMGLYLPIVTAIKDILHLNLKSFPTVFVFGCGVLVGIFSIVKLIRKALERFRAQMIFLIVGLMLGSIYAVIMGPTTLDTPQPAMTIHNFSILFFIIGGVVIFGLQQMKKIKK